MSLRSDSINFELFWPPIEEMLLNLLQFKYDKIPRKTWQGSFFDVYKVCVAPEELVPKLYSTLKDLLQRHVQELCKMIASNDTQDLLDEYYKQWNIYREAVGNINKVFGYLNTQHLKKTKKPQQVEADAVCQPGLEVKDLCLYLWNQEMISPLKQQLEYILLQKIELDRKGATVNSTVVSGVIHSLAEVEQYKREDTLELYREIFEKPFLQATGEYYRVEAEKYRSEMKCSSYMRKVLQIIDLETLRCTKFIHSSSKDKVINEIRSRMVADHSQSLHKESQEMVDSDCWQDLHAMYKLLKPIEGGLKTLIQQVRTRITQVGLDSIKQVHTSPNPSKEFVESFIEVYKKHFDLITSIFNSDQLFLGALDKACSAIINHRINPQQPCRSPELLAKYCDGLLRKPSSNSIQSSSATDTDDLDEKLSLSIILFKYIDDKDIFQKFYAKNMARRLILSQLASLDAEESMINKLKQVCGYEFTAKLHRMYTDIGLSNDLKELFNQHIESEKKDLGLNFSIYVLQAGSWPYGQSSIGSFELPKVFTKSVKEFEAFYNSRYTGRVLTWLYHYCSTDLKLCYTPKKLYHVSMQTFHAAILLLFETVDEMTYLDIQNGTQLDDDQLQKHLQGLLEAKILLVADEDQPTDMIGSSRISSVSVGTSNIEEAYINNNNNISNNNNNNDNINPQQQASVQPQQLCLQTKIRLNLDFSSKRSKLKIAVVQRDTQYSQAKEQAESEQTHSSIDEDRKLYMQAAIVRVMKSRRLCKHNQLMQEVIGLTKSHFTPNVHMIKKCIEILIEKQYLERKDDTTDEYKYVA